MIVTVRPQSRDLLVLVNGDEANDFKFLLAGWGGNLNFIANFAVEQRLADGRGRGDHSLFDVSLFGAYELVFDFDLALDVQHDDARTVTGTILWDVAEIEHAEIAHALFELADAGVNEALALFGKLVLGVFREVAVGPGDGNFLGQLYAELVLERSDLVLEFLLNVLEWVGHGVLSRYLCGQDILLGTHGCPQTVIIDAGELRLQGTFAGGRDAVESRRAPGIWY
jgi:hypothetical protein